MTTTIIGGVLTARLFHEREHGKVMKECHEETMKYIRDIYLPFHFMTEAFRRYPGIFANRSARWRRIKRRKVGHDRPNVWTGALRRAVLTESVIRKTQDFGKLEAKAPLETMIKFGPNAGKMIRRPLTEQRRKEMEFVSDDEIDQQRERMRLQYQAAVFDPAHQTKVLKQFR